MNLTPVEAIAAEIDRVNGFPAMDDFGPYYARMRAVHIAALELAKADAEHGDLNRITDAHESVRSARAKLYEALQR